MRAVISCLTGSALAGWGAWHAMGLFPDRTLAQMLVLAIGCMCTGHVVGRVSYLLGGGK